MRNFTRIFAGICAVITVFSVTGCNKKKSDKQITQSSQQSEELEGQPLSPVDGQVIYWMSDYDITGSEEDNVPTALQLLRDKYGASIQYLNIDVADKYNVLENSIHAGDTVDMFPYDPSVFPQGVARDWFEPLDNYYDQLDMENTMWDEMRPAIEALSYNGSHYVIPFDISEPSLIIYSRQLMKSEGLQDPYQLYLDGKWNWDTFSQMMKTFVDRTPEDAERFGIKGLIGKPLMQSTGQPIVSLENGQLKNNVSSPKINEAESFMANLSESGLYDNETCACFPSDFSTLFLGAGQWALGKSNAVNPQGDIMIVPYPKSADATDYTVTADYQARMLVKNSDKGEAVADYIKCERMVAYEQKFRDAAKQNALAVEKDAKGVTESFITQEQYDAIQKITHNTKTPAMIDFAYGISDAVSGNTVYYTPQSVVNRLARELLASGDNSDDTRNALITQTSQTVDTELAAFNKGTSKN